MPEMYDTQYPALVADRDGDQMPFNPEAVGDPRLPNWHNMDWRTNWCRCGHLIVDHHTDSRFSAAHPYMPCWAVGCRCALYLGGTGGALTPKKEG